MTAFRNYGLRPILGALSRTEFLIWKFDNISMKQNSCDSLFPSATKGSGVRSHLYMRCADKGAWVHGSTASFSPLDIWSCIFRSCIFWSCIFIAPSYTVGWVSGRSSSISNGILGFVRFVTLSAEKFWRNWWHRSCSVVWTIVTPFLPAFPRRR